MIWLWHIKVERKGKLIQVLVPTSIKPIQSDGEYTRIYGEFYEFFVLTASCTRITTSYIRKNRLNNMRNIWYILPSKISSSKLILLTRLPLTGTMCTESNTSISLGTEQLPQIKVSNFAIVKKLSNIGKSLIILIKNSQESSWTFFGIWAPFGST